MPLAEIAKKVGLSTTTVARRRINRLQEQGIIKSTRGAARSQGG